MHLLRILAVSATLMAATAAGPAAMAAHTTDQPATLQLVRGGGGGGGHFGGVGGGRGYAWGGNWRYHPWVRGYGVGGYPYAYACVYPYAYPYCAVPD